MYTYTAYIPFYCLHCVASRRPLKIQSVWTTLEFRTTPTDHEVKCQIVMQLKRYIHIVTNFPEVISCEFCNLCGNNSLFHTLCEGRVKKVHFTMTEYLQCTEVISLLPYSFSSYTYIKCIHEHIIDNMKYKQYTVYFHSQVSITTTATHSTHTTGILTQHTEHTS